MKNVFVIALFVCAAQALIKRNYQGSLNEGFKFLGLSDEIPMNQDPAPQRWFKQKLDHYSPVDTRTWNQRYYVNDTFWKGNGYPIFLMLGGEGTVNPTCVGGRFVFAEWAAKFNAMAICVEHRFYGASVPTADTTPQSLRYLTTPQALADYAAFRQGMTEKYRAPDSAWIAFGGSYSGSLAAWQRIKYPHLFAGAIASSAPVRAKEDFPEYFQVVQQAIGPSCATRVKQAIARIDDLLDTAQGRSYLQTTFGACDPIQTPNDLIQFSESITDMVCGVVQYSNDNNRAGTFNIERMCNILEHSSSDPLLAYANFVHEYQNFSGEACLDSSYAKYIKTLRNVDPSSDSLASRSWTWQTCIEYGYFQRTEEGMSPFSKRITLSFFEQICRDLFDAPLIPDTEWVNTYFGSDRPVGTNIIFPNGGVDPWHVLSVLKDVGPEMPHVLIPATAHCADLYLPRDEDDKKLTQVRELEVQLIEKWLSQHKLEQQLKKTAL